LYYLLFNPVFVVFAALTICAVASVVSVFWYRTRRAEIDAALKQTMIDRGMSADEIERVLRASNARIKPLPGARGS
jgi:hypothetical protein